ncbi:MAG: ubiquinol-cytochrome c reductase cytochrome b subunit [Streptosporangiales bacterium]|nr:ubiquinol-cytochrome c reductase cytochrome b subunit [Streptosporangiales bacterium]
MTTPPTPKALGGVGTYIDDRFHSARFAGVNLRKVFPNHWSFMLGEIALYSFIIILLSGTFLTFWFNPSMHEVVYDGSYTKLHGVTMSQAYESTLRISFDVRGGLLMRQVHHWAALIFIAAMFVHMLRVFFTGAFRKPRELNWLIGATLLILGFVEGLLGYSLPDDLLSGMGLRIAEGVLLSIPVVGTYLMFFLFGGEFPGHDIIPRFFTLHVLLIPGIMLALVVAHFMILWHQKHTQYPGKGKKESNVIGTPMYPAFAVKAGAFFFFVFGVTALLGAFAQINPVWLYGPFTPAAISSGSQPDFYMGWLEGSLRVFPAWEINAFGYTLALSVLIPALGIPGLVFTPLIIWPFLEQWVTGDKRQHHVVDRPRNAPVRTAFGMSGVTLYGLLWLAGANDVISERLDVPLYGTTWFFRFALILGPIIAFIVTKRICLGLQRRDAAAASHGYESGIIKQLPSGEFIEVHQLLTEDAETVAVAKKEVPALAAAVDGDGVPSPGSRSMMGRVRSRLHNFVVKDDIPVGEPHGNGHGDGHGGRPELGEAEAEERKELRH